MQVDLNNNGLNGAIEYNATQLDPRDTGVGVTECGQPGVTGGQADNGSENQKRLPKKSFVKRKRAKSESSCGIKIKFRRLSTEVVTQLSIGKHSVAKKQV